MRPNSIRNTGTRPELAAQLDTIRLFSADVMCGETLSPDLTFLVFANGWTEQRFRLFGTLEGAAIGVVAFAVVGVDLRFWPATGRGLSSLSSYSRMYLFLFVLFD